MEVDVKEGDLVLYHGRVERKGGSFKEKKPRVGVVVNVLHQEHGTEAIHLAVVPFYSTAQRPWHGPPRIVVQPAPGKDYSQNGLKRMSQAAVDNVSIVPIANIKKWLGPMDPMEFIAIKHMLSRFLSGEDLTR